ncbi:nuclear egress lamina protein [Psittacid alphaherpesvirus 5]|uniref:Nuclear egress lamina protein n=1 Tax=Psittacid alphaherpesvirus 5 TaxID=2972693 RepID=A0A5P9JRU9_9ALPH|nr:nuclear egress lamina protein [Psittacid alphaherpesvirus 5]QFU14568.1 nuclear egress lamina protein [Psittacid alphaherpesvirus 5]UOO01039.1 nuclear egress lamina protein [Psittacid alphaherpesvirus 5]
MSETCKTPLNTPATDTPSLSSLQLQRSFYLSPRRSLGRLDVKRRRRSLTWKTKPYRRPSRRPSQIERRTFFDTFFNLLTSTPSETTALMRSMVVPVAHQETVALPFEFSANFAPGDCISLSEMGYTLGMGSGCSLCSFGWTHKNPPDIASLELAFLHHLSSVVEFKELVTSLRVLAGDSDISEGIYESKRLRELIVDILNQPTLFYAYYTLKCGSSQDFKVLLKKENNGIYLMTFVFTSGQPLHIGSELLKRLVGNCPGYRWFADVLSDAFILTVRRNIKSPISEPRRVKLDPENVYRRYCDISVTEEKAHLYAHLYETFKTYSVPGEEQI